MSRKYSLCCSRGSECLSMTGSFLFRKIGKKKKKKNLVIREDVTKRVIGLGSRDLKIFQNNVICSKGKTNITKNKNNKGVFLRTSVFGLKISGKIDLKKFKKSVHELKMKFPFILQKSYFDSTKEKFICLTKKGAVKKFSSLVTYIPADEEYPDFKFMDLVKYATIRNKSDVSQEVKARKMMEAVCDKEIAVAYGPMILFYLVHYDERQYLFSVNYPSILDEMIDNRHHFKGKEREILEVFAKIYNSQFSHFWEKQKEIPMKVEANFSYGDSSFVNNKVKKLQSTFEKGVLKKFNWKIVRDQTIPLVEKQRKINVNIGKRFYFSLPWKKKSIEWLCDLFSMFLCKMFKENSVSLVYFDEGKLLGVMNTTLTKNMSFLEIRNNQKLVQSEGCSLCELGQQFGELLKVNICVRQRNMDYGNSIDINNCTTKSFHREDKGEVPFDISLIFQNPKANVSRIKVAMEFKNLVFNQSSVLERELVCQFISFHKQVLANSGARKHDMKQVDFSPVSPVDETGDSKAGTQGTILSSKKKE